MSLLVAKPQEFLIVQNLLAQPHLRKFIRAVDIIKLHKYKLSGDLSESQAFLKAKQKRLHPVLKDLILAFTR